MSDGDKQADKSKSGAVTSAKRVRVRYNYILTVSHCISAHSCSSVVEYVIKTF